MSRNLPAGVQRTSTRGDREEFDMNAQDLIDSIEADIERIRNLDAALLASLIHRLDELRKLQR